MTAGLFFFPGEGVGNERKKVHKLISLQVTEIGVDSSCTLSLPSYKNKIVDLVLVIGPSDQGRVRSCCEEDYRRQFSEQCRVSAVVPG